jgi:hypothetical protein
MQSYNAEAQIQELTERGNTLSTCKENMPMHFFPYKQVYVIKDILPTPITREAFGSGY